LFTGSILLIGWSLGCSNCLPNTLNTMCICDHRICPEPRHNKQNVCCLTPYHGLKMAYPHQNSCWGLIPQCSCVGRCSLVRGKALVNRSMFMGVKWVNSCSQGTELVIMRPSYFLYSFSFACTYLFLHFFQLLQNETITKRDGLILDFPVSGTMCHYKPIPL
jgi:hypothetical protein